MDFFVRTLASFLISLAHAGLLEPLKPGQRFPGGTGVEIIMNYLEDVWPWLIGIGVGLALLRIVIGGIEIMNSGGNPGLRTAAKDHIMWAIAGLLMLIMAGAILVTINPSAYSVV